MNLDAFCESCRTLEVRLWHAFILLSTALTLLTAALVALEHLWSRLAELVRRISRDCRHSANPSAHEKDLEATHSSHG